MIKLMFIGLTTCIVSIYGIQQVYHEPQQEEKVIVKADIKPDVVTVEYDTLHLNRGTRYNATVAQCDDSPFKTADGSTIVPSKVKSGEQRWVALSRDLILDEYRDNLYSNETHWKGHFRFGDTILVESEAHPFINGEWVVHDCMSARAYNSIDFLTAVGATPKLGVARDIKIIIKR
jgi:hypothetical protein